MAISGTWWLFFNWWEDGVGYTGYSNAKLSFNADGTFTDQNGPGRWVQIDGTLLFKFDDGDATYAGNLVHQSVTGIVTTFGHQGCFYMLQEGVRTAFTAERVAGKPDNRGKP